MGTDIATRPEANVAVAGVLIGPQERALMLGDLAGLSADERAGLIARLCESLGLNPLTKPFDYIPVGKGENAKLTLYANKNCTDQLNMRYGVSIELTLPDEATIKDIYVVRARAILADGRFTEAIGATPLVREGGTWKQNKNGKWYFEGTGEHTRLSPEEECNARMHAETKASRRASIKAHGLGVLDQSEFDTMAIATAVRADGASGGAPHAELPRRLGQGSVTDLQTGDVTESLPDAEELAPSDKTLQQVADREFLIATFFAITPPPQPPVTVREAALRYDHAGSILKRGVPNPLAPATEAMMTACLEKTQALITAGGTGEVLDEGMTTAQAWARYQQDAKALKALAGKPAAPAVPLASEQQIDRLLKLQTAIGRPATIPEGLTGDEAAAMIREYIGIFNAQSRGGQAQAKAAAAPNPADPAAPPPNADDPFDGLPF